MRNDSFRLIAPVLLATALLLAASNARGAQTLMEARAGHVTKLVPSEYQPDGPADDPEPGAPYVKVKYPSKVGPLVAYVTPDPKDGKKRPAIVWAHGGFGGIGEYYWWRKRAGNDQTLK